MARVFARQGSLHGSLCMARVFARQESLHGKSLCTARISARARVSAWQGSLHGKGLCMAIVCAGQGSLHGNCLCRARVADGKGLCMARVCAGQGSLCMAGVAAWHHSNIKDKVPPPPPPPPHTHTQLEYKWSIHKHFTTRRLQMIQCIARINTFLDHGKEAGSFPLMMQSSYEAQALFHNFRIGVKIARAILL